MKKATTIIAAMFITYYSFSQTPSFSVQGGLNLYCQDHIQDATTESWNEDFILYSSPDRVQSIKKVKFIPGFNIGVNVSVPLATQWVFKPGLQFNIKGGKAKGMYGSGGQSYPFSGGTVLGYIDVPLSFQYWINKKMYLELGPQVGFLLTAKYKENDDGDNYESTDKSDYNKLEASICGGGGYLFGDSGFGVFARFMQGVTKVDKSESYYSNVRNSTGQYGVFYNISRAKK